MNKAWKKAKVLWVDFLANGPILVNEQKRQSYVENAKKAGFTHIIVDAKIPYGYVTYKSEIATHVGNWERFRDWAGVDYVEVMLEVIKKYEMKAILKLDVFAEGSIANKDALDSSKKEWQVTYYQLHGTVPTFTKAEDYSEQAIFVNPAHPDVRAYELSIIRELVSKYECDGVVLDRCRYPNVYGDFSQFSRKAFENDIGEEVPNWPEDIFTSVDQQVKGGPLYKKWLTWRACQIKGFVIDAKAVVKEIGESIGFGLYVGSWYPEFYHEGVNWGSPDFAATYDWMDVTYAQTGYANEIDYLMTGCYYPHVRKSEALEQNKEEWKTVEGAIELSSVVTQNNTPIIAGLFLQEYVGNEVQFQKAVNICIEKSDGMMIFDAFYLETYNWWRILIEKNSTEKELKEGQK